MSTHPQYTYVRTRRPHRHGRKMICSAFAALALGALPACDAAFEMTEPGAESVAGVLLSAAGATLGAGESVQVHATLVGPTGTPIGSPSAGTARGAAVTWSSADPSVAVVNGAGIVVAARAGETMVTATSGQAVARMPIVVRERPPTQVARLQVAPRSQTVSIIGGTAHLSVVATDLRGTPIGDPAVTWSSLDPTVARVDGRGVVTAFGSGTARITAVAGGVADTAEVLVRYSVHTVPASIVADCSADMTRQLNDWIASVPDSSTLVFGRNACYNIDGGLIVVDRHGLTFDGNGSTFRVFSEGDPNRSNWTIRAGSDITLRNMTARGAHPRAGIHHDSHVGRLEWQHGFRFQATQTGTLDNVQVYDVYGDFFEAEPDWTRVAVWPGEPARNITVRNSRFERNGRMGAGLTHVDGFLMENSYMGEVSLSAIDVELDDALATGRNVRIIGNRFGRVRHGVFTNFGQGNSAGVGNHVFSNNVMEAAPVTCIPPVWAGAPGEGIFWTGYVFEGNTIRTAGNAFEVTRIRDVRIRNNTVIFHPGGGCERPEAVRARNSHGGIVQHNTIIGAPSWYKVIHADALTTGFSVSDNTFR
jgi:hypothetical protein